MTNREFLLRKHNLPEIESNNYSVSDNQLNQNSKVESLKTKLLQLRSKHQEKKNQLNNN